MLSLAIRYRAFVFSAVLIIALVSWAGLWVSRQKQEAVNEFKQEIEKVTTEQIKNDEAKVVEAFEPSDSINSHVDRMLSVNTESATSSDSGLLSVEENTEADGRGQAGLNPVLQSGLSDIEVNEAVRRYADVLQ